MPRLPSPGSDTNNWGALLNEFLQTGHYADGTTRMPEVTYTVSPLIATTATSQFSLIPGAALDIVSSAAVNGDVFFPLTLPGNVRVTNVTLSYRVSNASTSIKRVRILQHLPTLGGVVAFDSPVGVVLDSTTSTTYQASTTTLSIPVVGPLTLLLFCSFADPSHIIRIGPIGIYTVGMPPT